MYKSKPSSKSSLKRTASNNFYKSGQNNLNSGYSTITDMNVVARKELEDKNLKLMSIEMNFETVSQICAAEKEKN